MRAVLAEGGKSSIPPEPQHAEEHHEVHEDLIPTLAQAGEPPPRRRGRTGPRPQARPAPAPRQASPPTLDSASYQLTCLARKQPHCVKGTEYRPGGCNP